jgi:glycosyltransferase involved in cell wall biosynthesis
MAILTNTTLCVIIRDEMQNPAGGVERFIDSCAPFVEKVIVIDTGSVDGSYKKLKELSRKHSNITLKKKRFWFFNYAKARNYYLKRVKTTYVLVLDADEILADWGSKSIKQGFRNLAEFLNQNPGTEDKPGYIFTMENLLIGSSGETWIIGSRLFRRLKGMEYRNTKNIGKEWVFFRNQDLIKNSISIPKDVAVIVHFRPKKAALKAKSNELYKALRKGKNPSQVISFMEWKEYNKKRDHFH